MSSAVLSKVLAPGFLLTGFAVSGNAAGAASCDPLCGGTYR